MCDWGPTNRLTRIDWLLERDNPSVRYFTLIHLLGCPADDPEAVQASEAIMRTGPVPVILGRQRPDGGWSAPEDFYLRSKYRGTVWTLILLASLGADGADERVQRACDYTLNHVQDPASGGFAYRPGLAGGDPDSLVPCLTGNMVWSLLRMGRLDDPRVWRGGEWIAATQRCDDGGGAGPKGRPYEGRENCWGRHTCMMGVVKGLKALAEVPPERRTPPIEAALAQGAEFILTHHVFKRSHDLVQVAKPSWLKLGYPLMANTDVLEMTGVLARLGCRDPRLDEAVELILSKQDRQGRWALEATYNGRMQVRVERLGQPSKWVTLKALETLMGLGISA